MKDIKNKLTTICGILFVIATALLGAEKTQDLHFPGMVDTICGSVIAITGALTMWLTGRNPDGSTKSDGQLQKAAEEKAK